MTFEAGALIVPASHGAHRWSDRTLTTIKASSSDTGGAWTLLEITAAPGSGAALHVHRHADEAVYILEGELELRCADRTWTARSGDFALLPSGLPHGHEVRGDRPCRLLALVTPGGYDDFITRISTPADAATLPPTGRRWDPAEALSDVAATFGIDVTPGLAEPSL